MLKIPDSINYVFTQLSCASQGLSGAQKGGD